ncbi:hypothetical protein MVEN_00260900 [Mycena venus]|uniref:Exocyst complex subunit Exo70 C-terminal domain-containing protein n=1 Tax=Mycena venus TaxID=2733690 RepID=A0A8H7DFA0_9AGAR|nr:hypothetical protein MVEN_00260900 [Mycena venus]
MTLPFVPDAEPFQDKAAAPIKGGAGPHYLPPHVSSLPFNPSRFRDALPFSHKSPLSDEASDGRLTQIPDIENAFLKIDEVASNQEEIAAEEALILHGQASAIHLPRYPAHRFATGPATHLSRGLECLNASIAFKSSDRDSLDTARLRVVQTGAKKLTQLFTKLVSEASTGSTPSSKFQHRDLCCTLPSSDPSYTAAAGSVHAHPAPCPHRIQGVRRRGTWSRKCLEAQGKRVIDRADTVDSIVAGKDFGRWVESLLSVADEEYKYIKELTPLSSPDVVASSYNTLLNPILSLFSTTLTSLLAFIKRSLHKYAFFALGHLLTRRGSENAKANELKDGLSTLRGVCLRSFPEFLADIKMASLQKAVPGMETSVSVADFVISAVKYMDRLPEVHSAAAAALLQLGDGNWKMGEGVAVSAEPKLGDGDEQVILEHFIYDVVTTAITSLTTISRSQRRPAHDSMYLLNNISYLRHNTVLEPAHEALLDFLSKPTQDALNSNFRTAKAAYFDTNFSPLLLTLTDDAGRSGKSGAKAR